MIIQETVRCVLEIRDFPWENKIFKIDSPLGEKILEKLEKRVRGKSRVCPKCLNRKYNKEMLDNFWEHHFPDD